MLKYHPPPPPTHTHTHTFSIHRIRRLKTSGHHHLLKKHFLIFDSSERPKTTSNFPDVANELEIKVRGQ